MIQMYDLHRAGAQVLTGDGDAWLRHPRVRAHDATLLDEIAAARRRLGRAVCPDDLVPDAGAAGRPLAASERERLRALVAQHPAGQPLGGVAYAAVLRALDGEPITPRILDRLLLAMVSPAVAPPPTDPPPTTAAAPAAPPESPMPTPLPIVARIDAVRGSRTYKTVAEESGVHVTTIYRAKRGEPLKPEMLAKLESWCAAPASPVPVRVVPPADAPPAPAPAAAPLVLPADDGQHAHALLAVAKALGYEPRTVWIVTDTGDLVKTRGIVL
jgi:hypothetical protein